MFVFNRANTLWLPAVALFLAAYALVLFTADGQHHSTLIWFGPLLTLPLMGTGVAAALKGSGIDGTAFFRRPANIATLIRSLLLTAGVSIASYTLGFPGGESNPGLRVTAAVFIVVGFIADKVDGVLARHEKNQLAAARLGPWYDAETDALAIYFAGVLAVYLGIAPAVLLVAAFSRYLFGLLYSFVPAPLQTPRWYGWFSKMSAGFLQGVIGYTWAAALLFLGDKAPLYPGPDFFTDPLPVASATYTISGIILLSFLLETYFRLRTLSSAVAKNFRKGLMVSFLIYFRVPFRYLRMLRFYRTLISPGELVFDIGAHLGNRIRVFSALKAKVVAFEPQPSCRKLLEMWFGKEKTVTLDFSALGEADGVKELVTSSGNPTLASVDKNWIRKLKEEPEFKKVDWDGSTTVSVISLQTAISAYGKPGFIKIDAEGFEAQILSGLVEPVESLSFEFIPSCKQRAKTCVELLKNLASYEFNFSIGESMRFCFEDWKNFKEIADFLDEYSDDGRSGDIYARMVEKT